MSASANYTDVAAYRAYVEEFAPGLLSKLFVSFKSATLNTAHEGVKGRKTLTELTISDLVTRYGRDFAPKADAVDFAPRVLNVADAKVDLKFVPKDMESSYLGRARRQGQDSMDMPFIGFILERILAKVASEQEVAYWRGIAAGTPAATDALTALFDGFSKIIADEQTASNLTPVVTGALTNTNAVGIIESMYTELGSQYQDVQVDIFMNPSTRIKLIQDYRERYGKYVVLADGSIKLDIGNAIYHSCPGMKDNAVIITPMENLHYGYDGAMDSSMFNFEQEDRAMKLWMDFKMGVQIGIVHDDIIVTNDQH